LLLHLILVLLTYKVLVARIVLLLIGGDVLLAASPGIGSSGPGAVGLNGDVVLTSKNADESLFTEVLTPRVPDGPVLGAVLDTITDDRDVMDNVLVTGLILIDARGVVLKSIRDSDTTSNGSTLVDFLHHGFLTRDLAELGNLVSVVLIGNEASLSGHAVLALEHGAALNTVIVSTSSVDGASFVGNVVVVHPLEGVVSLTTVAAIIT
jgi:hypothetical protein